MAGTERLMKGQAVRHEDSTIHITQPMTPVQLDFDHIALLPKEKWSHNDHYHRFLLDQLPPHCSYALEIGCGTGAFSRLLAKHVE